MTINETHVGSLAARDLLEMARAYGWGTPESRAIVSAVEHAAIAAVARQGGDVKQAPGEAPQSVIAQNTPRDAA